MTFLISTQTAPEKQELHESILRQLHHCERLRVTAVQFGTLGRSPMSHHADRAFAVDHERRFDGYSTKAWIQIQYEHKEIQIHVSLHFQFVGRAVLTDVLRVTQMGNSMTEEWKDTIIMKWSSIRSMSMGNGSGDACTLSLSY